jgi:hypothetical protein
MILANSALTARPPAAASPTHCMTSATSEPCTEYPMAKRRGARPFHVRQRTLGHAFNSTARSRSSVGNRCNPRGSAVGGEGRMSGARRWMCWGESRLGAGAPRRIWSATACVFSARGTLCGWAERHLPQDVHARQNAGSAADSPPTAHESCPETHGTVRHGHRPSRPRDHGQAP